MEDLVEFLQKMVWLRGIGFNCSWDIVEKYQKNGESTKEYQNPGFLNVEILLMVAQNCIILKGLNKTFQMNLNILPKLGLGIQQKVHKMNHFWHFNDQLWEQT